LGIILLEAHLMHIPLRLLPVILILLIVIIAGFSLIAFACSLAAVGTKHSPPFFIVLIMFGQFALLHGIIILLVSKIWRSPASWIFLGQRKRLWQFLIPLAYVFGVIGGIASIPPW
jgi:hypothetical protein